MSYRRRTHALIAWQRWQQPSSRLRTFPQPAARAVARAPSSARSRARTLLCSRAGGARARRPSASRARSRTPPAARPRRPAQSPALSSCGAHRPRRSTETGLERHESGGLARRAAPASRRGTPRLDAGGLLEEVGDGRRLDDESERPVLERGDHDGHGHERLVRRGAVVELLAELHDVEAALAEGAAHGRLRRRLARGDHQPDRRRRGLGCHAAATGSRLRSKALVLDCRVGRSSSPRA